ncbi:urea ABC transporter permease subunit UrtC [Aminobacter ciceronei]|uniref:Urea transport system permease protein n=1 Tax=Aminobacter ciceronei TaxID=150723 RepID=A0ABR6C8Q1_9HYPH|nr:urea ABC transporter permease subunit UrtC [Aminobacter ciceronei]MBA8907754.1 urea transport system permease protein [Aminobacter ciceronei]MBA9021397.1 urea transport system permease protein [Aminobacter ciceronei]
MTYRTASIIAYIAFFAVVLALPLVLNSFWTNRVAIYLVYSICAIGISMSWGYAGILSLGQGLFFGMGAYMLAMSLTLAVPENNPVPQLMLLNMEPNAVRDLCCVTTGSFLWIPFRSVAVGMIAGIVVPCILAAAIGYVMFKRRTTGVYVSIITLAFAVIGQLLIINNQPLTGGFNGLADLALLEIGGFEFDPYGPSAYYAVALTLIAVILLARYMLTGRIGQVLKAIREDEARARYLGYDVENYKLFIFCVSAGVAGLAGMLFTVTSEFATPSLMATSLSISMVIWAATGGRASLLGACIGALIVNFVGSLASESATFQPVWPIILGLLFVVVVLFMPNGIAGIFKAFIDRPGKAERLGGAKLSGKTERPDKADLLVKSELSAREA